MATLEPGLQFTGSIGSITAYKIKATGKIVLRTKGGPTKKQVKNSPAFARTRENNMEMGGRSRAAKWVRYAMGDITRLADHQPGNALQPLIKEIQYNDSLSQRGERNICFSQTPGVLPGFQVNRRFVVEQLLTSPLVFEMDTMDRSALLRLPAIKPGLNLFVPSYATWFGMTVCLALVPDIIHTASGYAPNAFDTPRVQEHTPWYATNDGCEGQEIRLQLAAPPAVGTYTMMLSLGIRLAKTVAGGLVQQHRYAGAGKILAMAPLL